MSELEVEDKYGAKIDACLRDVFGHGGFRQNQREIVRTFLGGEDCFVLIPTGTSEWFDRVIIAHKASY